MALSAGLVNAQTVDNWMASGQPVKSGTGLCWRDANWTPATAAPGCDGAIVAPKTAPVPKAEAPKPLVTKLNYAADTFFDFDKSVITPAGKQVLGLVVKNLTNLKLEVVIVIGHTDSVGTDAYNIKLGERRANAVKAYLASQGVDATRIYTESKGERQPIADNATKEGRAKNRRVEIEVVGTQK